MGLNVVAVVISLVLLSIAAIILNCLCIVIICMTKKLLRKPSTIFLLNLLVVHLVQGLFVFPLYAGKKLKVTSIFWASVFSTGFRFTYILTFYGTCLGVLWISLDRFLATYWLQKYKPRMTKKRVSIILIVVWIYVILLCLIPFIPQTSSSSTETTNTTKSYPQTQYYVPQKEWVVFMLLTNTTLPYMVIILCYVYIMKRLWEMSKIRTRSRACSAITIIDHHGDEIKFKRKDLKQYRHVTILTFVLVVSYGLFWTPSILYYPLESFCKSCFPEEYEDSDFEKHTSYIIKYLMFIDSIAAPLIYCFYHAEFRKALMRMRSKVLKKPIPETQFERTEYSNELL